MADATNATTLRTRPPPWYFWILRLVGRRISTPMLVFGLGEQWIIRMGAKTLSGPTVVVSTPTESVVPALTRSWPHPDHWRVAPRTVARSDTREMSHASILAGMFCGRNIEGFSSLSRPRGD